MTKREGLAEAQGAKIGNREDMRGRQTYFRDLVRPYLSEIWGKRTVPLYRRLGEHVGVIGSGNDRKPDHEEQGTDL